MQATIFGGTAKKSPDNINKNIERIASECFTSIASCNSHFVFKNRIGFAKPSDLFRLLSEVRSENCAEKDFLLRHVYNAEKSCPGSGFILLSMLSGNEISVENIGKFSSSFLKKMISESDLEILSDVFYDSIVNGGSNCSVVVSKSEGASYVSCSDDLSFPAIQIKEFGENIEFSNPYVSCYNGVVERISQLERIINFQTENNAEVVILARGFSYDVVSTLLYNWNNKRLKIVPITCDVDWTSEFVMKDLSICLNINEENLGVDSLRLVEKAKILNSKLMICDRECSLNAKKLSNEISLDMKNNPSIKEFANYRLKFLSTRKITIAVGNEFGEAKEMITDRIDFLNRCIISSKIYGSCTLKIDKIHYTCSKKAFLDAFLMFNSIKKVGFSTKLVKNVA